MSFSPRAHRCGGSKKNIGNKGEACRSVGCIGRAGPYCSGETALCNHVDFYGISYYREIYGKGRGEETHGRDCPAIIRGAAGSRGALAPVVATFIALFIALLNFFFPRRKEQGEEKEEEEEAPLIAS